MITLILIACALGVLLFSGIFIIGFYLVLSSIYEHHAEALKLIETTHQLCVERGVVSLNLIKSSINNYLELYNINKEVINELQERIEKLETKSDGS